MNTCEWCGRKWNDGPIYNILVGTNTARAKTVCSEKCKKEIIEEKGEPTIEAKNEWGRKAKEIRLEKEAAKNAKEDEKEKSRLETLKHMEWVKNNGMVHERMLLFVLSMGIDMKKTPVHKKLWEMIYEKGTKNT